MREANWWEPGVAEPTLFPDEESYKSRFVGVHAQPRAVRCAGCYRKIGVWVSKQNRLRAQRSPCCGARMHPVNWAGWKDGRG